MGENLDTVKLTRLKKCIMERISKDEYDVACLEMYRRKYLPRNLGDATKKLCCFIFERLYRNEDKDFNNDKKDHNYGGWDWKQVG